MTASSPEGGEIEMCWSRYEDRWTVEQEREIEEETRRLLTEAEERAKERTEADEHEPELVEA